MESPLSADPKVEVNQVVFFRALSTTYRVVSAPLNGSAAIVEHTVESYSIGAPMHRHTHEDEISYVLDGQLSVIQDGVIQIAKAGDFVVKPRGIFHTFWNATSTRVRFLEILIPGRLEGYYAEIAPYLVAGQAPKLDKLKEAAMKYGLIIDPQATAELIARQDLKPLS